DLRSTGQWLNRLVPFPERSGSHQTEGDLQLRAGPTARGRLLAPDSVRSEYLSPRFDHWKSGRNDQRQPPAGIGGPAGGDLLAVRGVYDLRPPQPSLSDSSGNGDQQLGSLSDHAGRGRAAIGLGTAVRRERYSC